MASVNLEGVSKRFGATRAVEDISLTVADGEFFALLGPSGCGKTTLLRLVAGFEQPDAGSVRLANEIVSTAVSGVITGDQLHSLPLYNRNFLTLGTLTPNTHELGAADPLSGGSFSVSGNRGTADGPARRCRGLGLAEPASPQTTSGITLMQHAR